MAEKPVTEKPEPENLGASRGTGHPADAERAPERARRAAPSNEYAGNEESNEESEAQDGADPVGHGTD